MRLAPIVQSLTEPLLSPLVSAITGASGSGFSPTSLFVSGQQGYVYDLNDQFAEKTAYRRNLLTWSEQLNNVAWIKTRASVVDGFPSLDGGTSFKLVEDTSAANTHQVRQIITMTSGGTYTFSVVIKAGETDKFDLFIWGLAGTESSFDLTAETATKGANTVSVTLTKLEDGWFLATATWLYSGTGAGPAIGLRNSSGQSVYTGDGVSGLYIDKSQFELGSTATEYQRVTNWNTELLAAFPQTSVFLDSAGTTAASVNGLVGLVLDKSKGLALGAELVTNGDFSAGSTGWTLSGQDATHVLTFSGGTVRYQSDTTSPVMQLAQVFSATASAWYLVEIVISNYVSGSLKFDSDFGDVAVPAAVGTHRFYFKRDSGGFSLYRNSANVDITIDSISIKRVQGNHAYQATTGNKPVLRGTPVGGNLVTNGDFASGTGWTVGAGWAITGGQLVATAATGIVSRTVTLTGGNVYRLTVGSNTAALQIRFVGGTGQSITFASGTPTVRYFTYTAGAGNTFEIVANGTTSGVVDNVEIVDVSADSVQAPYALQFDGVDDFLRTASVDFATVTSDGLARRNLLTFPSAFDNAAWTKAGATITANATTAPDGLLTADTLVEDTSTGQHRVIQAATVVASTTYAASFYVKANGRTRFEIFDNASASNTSAIFDLSSGTLVSKGAAAITADIVSVGSGWFRVVVTTVPAVTTYSPTIRLISSGTTISYTGDGASGIFLWGAQLEAGSTASAFQDIGTDKMTVCHGVRKLSDAARGMLVELGNATTASFRIEAPNAAAPNYRWASYGSLESLATVGSALYAAPVTNVLTGIGNISGDSAGLRVNGVDAVTSATDQGTGNYANAVIYLGRRGGASLPYNGLFYSAICVGKTASATELANIERWTNQRTGAY
jgi:hypothetical protein